MNLMLHVLRMNQDQLESIDIKTNLRKKTYLIYRIGNMKRSYVNHECLCLYISFSFINLVSRN